MKAAPAETPVRSVSAITRYIQRLIRENKWFRQIGVRGEVSNLRKQSSSVRFDLKDEGAILRCVVWSEFIPSLPELENGLAVIATGYIDTFLKGSSYQLVAQSVTLEGIGDLHVEIENLKKKLEADGLFAAERKRPLPRYPYRIALVSSREARGMGDFVTIVARRAPHVEVELVETPVQGTGAAIEIADAIDRASKLDVDLIVVARGGGSFEDLYPFNTETVARAIVRAAHPVVSAVGHKYDVSISDLVADLRAETPSDAAHQIVPDRDELLARIRGLWRTGERAVWNHAHRAVRELERAMARSALAVPSRFLGPRRQSLDRLSAQAGHAAAALLRARKERVNALERRLERFDPSRRLADRGKALEVKRFRLERAAQERLVRARERLERVRTELDPAVRAGHHGRVLRIQFAQANLDGKNPEKILQRGYAIVRYDGAVVRDPLAVPEGARIEARVAHGTLVARVESREADGAE